MLLQELLNIEYPQALFAILITLAGYYFYYFPAHSKKLHARFIKTGDKESSKVKWVFYGKFWGFITMAVFPFFIFIILFSRPLPDYGLTSTALFRYWPWLMLTLILPVIINYFLARKPETLQQYPQMRISDWTRRRFAINVIGWVLYLFAYEYLFRGILLFSLYEVFGFWIAVAVNISLYSLAHFPKGSSETLGAIPFGLILCLVTLLTGTILFAVFLHISLALSTEYFAIKYNPEMHFKRKGVSR